MSKKSKSADFVRAYDREMLRSTVASVFWSVISQKKNDGFRLTDLAKSLGIHRSAVSRWFSGNAANWELNTISDIANALDVELVVRAVDRKTGVEYTPSGKTRASKQWAEVTFTSTVSSASRIHDHAHRVRTVGREVRLSV